MQQKITYAQFKENDFEDFLTMGRKLWKSHRKSVLRKKLKRVSTEKKYVIFLAKNQEQNNVGFSIFSLRTDYVEGAEQSPTGYFEGIFIAKDYRKLGIGKKFLKLGEKWCKKKGCTQMGSDTWVTNKNSRNFHNKLGFWEEEELVHFLKDLS